MKNPMTVRINGTVYVGVKEVGIVRNKDTGELFVDMTLRKGKEVQMTLPSTAHIIIEGPDSLLTQNETITVERVNPNREVDITGEVLK